MAFYIFLVKESEDQTGVTYSFGTDLEHAGKLHLDKTSGMIEEIVSIPAPDTDVILKRAAVKLRQH